MKQHVWLTVACLLACSAALATGQGTDAEARRHYRIALVALENNDLDTALEELRASVKLAPDNALAHFNLAVVCSKKALATEGIAALAKAREFGLPEKEKAAADDLEARLAYLERTRPRQERDAVRIVQDFLAANACDSARSSSSIEEVKDGWFKSTTRTSTDRNYYVGTCEAPLDRIGRVRIKRGGDCDSISIECSGPEPCVRWVVTTIDGRPPERNEGDSCQLVFGRGKVSAELQQVIDAVVRVWDKRGLRLEH